MLMDRDDDGLVIGLGCERGTPPHEVIRLAECAIAGMGSDCKIVCIASLDTRAGEPAILAAARHFSVPLRVFDASRLEVETPRLRHPSQRVFALAGCHGVAEAAALAAAGESGTLIVPKMKSAHATAAVALLSVVESEQALAAKTGEIESAASPSDSRRDQNERVPA